MVSKNFAFQFVNSNIALFSIAFNEQDFNNLSYQLAIIMVVKQLVSGLIEMILPKIGVWWRKRKLK
jgi:Calcium-activated chloride channel